MAPHSSQPSREGENDRIISPFSQTTTTVRAPSKGNGASWQLWIVSGLLASVVLAGFGYLSLKYLNDPYRTMELFSVDNYLADFQPLAGNKFKADFKVSADLGWKEGIGRLMVFTAKDDVRPILVLIPPKLASIFFTKGQTYQISLEVGEGGLIYADSCDKE